MEVKKIGNTGGIYFAEAQDPEFVNGKGMEAMSNGFGGDAPENDCEAILATLHHYQGVNEIFLVADNWANMRDISLMTRIGKPVHVILCGVRAGYFNTEYLDLARATGGSIHTLEADIVNLMKLSEGEAIEIGGVRYLIKNGRFVKLLEG